MRVQKVEAAQQVVSRWSGGTTTQLAIAPAGALYGDRNFLWRLSSAVVELPKSDFTPLPDYARILMILRGTLKLTHDGGPEITLGELEQDRFDGGSHTVSWGQVVDFNLMLRKGSCDGRVTARVLAPGETCSSLWPSGDRKGTWFGYCSQGGVRIEGDSGDSWDLQAGEGLQADGEKGEEAQWRVTNLSQTERAVLVTAFIWY